MPWAGAAIVIGSAAVGIVQAQQQASSQKALAEFNAEQDDERALRREAAGRIALDERKRQARRLISSQRAAFGKAGVRGEGTPLLTQIDTAENLAQDALTEQFNIRTGVQQARSRAEISRIQGRSAVRAGRLRVGQQLFQAGRQLQQLG